MRSASCPALPNAQTSCRNLFQSLASFLTRGHSRLKSTPVNSLGVFEARARSTASCTRWPGSGLMAVIGLPHGKRPLPSERSELPLGGDQGTAGENSHCPPDGRSNLAPVHPAVHDSRLMRYRVIHF